jgi:molybdopterin converting factor subunit 1
LPIRVKVLYFAQAKDESGSGEEEFSLPNRASLRTLLEGVKSRHRTLEKMGRTMQVAVNEEIAEEDAQLKDGDVVALLPPVEGG